MGGKRREILLDGLVVSDVRQHGIEDGKFGAARWNWNAGLCHECQQADGLQRNRFSSGIRASDDELAAVIFQLNRERDNVGPFRFQISFE